jgi:hypothetical protein
MNNISCSTPSTHGGDEVIRGRLNPVMTIAGVNRKPEQFPRTDPPGISVNCIFGSPSTIDGRQIKSVIYSRMHGLDGELTWHRDYIRSQSRS